MAQPVPYQPKADYTNDDGSDLRTNLDIDFNDIARCFLEVLTNLALIQRDDGQLANKSVGVEQLKAELIAGFNPPAPFQPYRLYEVSDSFVTDDGKWYIVNTGFTATANPADNADDITLVYDFASVRVDTIAAKDAAEAAQAAAELARNQAQTAQTAAETAQAAAEQAEQDATTIVQDVMVSRGIYANTAQGLENTQGTGDANRYFSVPSANTQGYLDLYRNDAGTAAMVDTYPNKTRIDALFTGDGANTLGVTTSTGAQTLADSLDRRTIYVDSVVDLLALDAAKLTNGQVIAVRGYRATSKTPVGLVEYDAARPKSDHNGYDVFSPTVPWDGLDSSLSDYFAGAGETDAAGTGVFVALERRGTVRISYIFDDGYTEHSTDLAPEFEQRGVRAGFAINPVYVNQAGRLTGTDLLKLYGKGHEILNHGASHADLRENTTALSFARAEIETGRQYLVDLGVNPVGFVASFSTVADSLLSAVKEAHGFAFTTYAALDAEAAIYSPDSNRYKLGRFNVDTSDTNSLLTAANIAVAEDSDLCFYGHNVSTNADYRASLIALLDHTVSLEGAQVVPPREVWGAYATKHQADTAYRLPVTGWSSSLTLTPGDDYLTITASTTGTGQTVILQRDVKPEAPYTFSAELIPLNGGVFESTLGMHYIDSAGNIIPYFSVETDAASVSANKRYFVSGYAPSNAVEIRLYLRIDTLTAGDLRLESPRLCEGGRILAEPSYDIDTPVSRDLLSTQSIPNAVFTTLQVTGDSDDGSVLLASSGIITAKEECLYHINARILAKDASIPAGKRAILGFSINGGASIGRTESVTFTGALTAQATRAIKLAKGDTVEVQLYQDTGISLSPTSGYSEINMVRVAP